MKSAIYIRNAVVAVICCLTVSCRQTSNNTAMNKTSYEKGTFGYDLEFMNTHKKPIILSDSSDSARVMIIPGWQARVMTSTAGGNKGFSYGWINYKLIESATPAEHINAFGGEERFWLGPEGGPFSLYFAPGKDQEFANWYVPALLDTVAFDLVSQSANEAVFGKRASLTNYSGYTFNFEINRKIKLLSKTETAKNLGIEFSSNILSVGYETENSITNSGTEVWTEKTGALSIWMLSMLNPSPGVTVFLPFKNSDSKEAIVNDDYFGKVPDDRLIIKDGIIWFKADGKYRSKIGLSPERVTELCGSYDANNKALTILWCKVPETKARYVNSKWGKQDDPFKGDVINSYNDGPVEDGTQMGPFYEIESSSPAGFLKQGERLVHTQRIYHFEGEEKDLDAITQKVFGISINQIKSIFTK